MGNRAGDNSQVLGLGEALGWPLRVEKHFEFQSLGEAGQPALGCAPDGHP